MSIISLLKKLAMRLITLFGLIGVGSKLKVSENQQVEPLQNKINN